MSYMHLVCPVCGERYTFGVVGNQTVGSGHDCPVKIERDKALSIIEGVRRELPIIERLGGSSTAKEAVQAASRIRELLSLLNDEGGDTEGLSDG